MSLKDLLPPDTYEELQSEAAANSDATSTERATETIAEAGNNQGIMVRCPTCHKLVPYSSSNPFRPFCSERCKLIDLGAWASDERSVPGDSVTEEDGYMLDGQDVPRR